MVKIAGTRQQVRRERAITRKEEAVLRQAARDLRTASEQIALLMTRPGLSLKEKARLEK